MPKICLLNQILCCVQIHWYKSSKHDVFACFTLVQFVLKFKTLLWKGSLLPWHTGNQHEKKQTDSELKINI